VLLLDACRDDPLPGSKGQLESFASHDYGEGIQILYSTSRNDFSWESPELGHGVFSYFINQGLSGQAAQGGVVTFANLANYVEENVSKWTFQHLKETQQPRQSSEGEPYGPFVLARLGNVPASQPESLAPVPTTPVTPTSNAIEPEMVNIPAGTFTMGCVDGRDNVEGVDKCPDSEKPAHEVSISAFQLAATDVTFEQWDACEAAKACPHADDKGWGRGNRPVINVSWKDAQGYIQWLNKESGKRFRLPTEAEWEYAARAGTDTAYSWGSKASHEFANYGEDAFFSFGGLASGKDQWVYTSPARSFAASPFGLYDMNGNVWQWVEDCYVDNYMNAPTDGSARQGCGANASRVLRGGSWGSKPRYLRSALRLYSPPVSRTTDVGFRAARTFAFMRQCHGLNGCGCA
jgi:formylglycine-generating enzyme required for sulfatase activity